MSFHYKNGNKDFIIAIGDIHGCYEKLLLLMEKINYLYKKPDDLKFSKNINNLHGKLIFLGDYIDRGKDSKSVISYLISISQFSDSYVFLRGNHEQVLLDFIEHPQQQKSWLSFGGNHTLLSYGVDCEIYLNQGKSMDYIRDVFVEKLPESHYEFFVNTISYCQNKSYFFVHAGVNPSYKLNKQKTDDLLWIRDEFIKSTKKFKKIIVHGHTPRNDVFCDDRRIGIDTGVYFEGGKLSAVILDGEEVSFISV